MAEGGFDPNDPNVFEMNEDVIPPDDEDITQNDPGFSGESQQETSFNTPEGSQASRWIELYRASFKSKYRIGDNTFDVLRLNLTQRGCKLYYKDAQINRKDGEGLYALTSIKGKGAAEFKRVVEEGQRTKQLTVQERPIEPTVVDRQPITFDNPAFDDRDDDELTERLTDLRTINADLEAAGVKLHTPLESYRTSGIPLETERNGGVD